MQGKGATVYYRFRFHYSHAPDVQGRATHLLLVRGGWYAGKGSYCLLSIQISLFACTGRSRTSNTSTSCSRRLVCRERELLSIIDSDFIIRMHRTFKDEQHIYFLFEAAGMQGKGATVYYRFRFHYSHAPDVQGRA